MSLRIFIGLTNVASQIGALKDAFELEGCRVRTGVLQNPSSALISQQAYDYVFLPSPPWQWKRFPLLYKASDKFIQAAGGRFVLNQGRIPQEIIDGHDVFLFMWSSFDPHFRDYQRLAELGKTIIVLFCGDDARWHAGVNQEFASLGMPPLPYQGRYLTLAGKRIHVKGYNFTLSGLAKRMEAVREAEKYAHVIFSKREQAQMQLRPFYHIFPMLDTGRIPCHTGQRNMRPVVVHAPSNPAVKGTSYVLDAFARLQKEGIDFEPVLLQNTPHAQALELYRNADIVIDQLLLPIGGKLTCEAMAAGCVVMTRMDYDRYDQGVDLHGCPVVDVNPENVYEKLKALILDYPLRQELALRNRDYVQQHWDVRVFVQKILRILERGDVPCDYTPQFFRQAYRPELPGETALLNGWTNYVRACPWYQDAVPPGERDGLVF